MQLAAHSSNSEMAWLMSVLSDVTRRAPLLSPLTTIVRVFNELLMYSIQERQEFENYDKVCLC